jgi:hypothetical protein
VKNEAIHSNSNNNSNAASNNSASNNSHQSSASTQLFPPSVASSIPLNLQQQQSSSSTTFNLNNSNSLSSLPPIGNLANTTIATHNMNYMLGVNGNNGINTESVIASLNNDPRLLSNAMVKMEEKELDGIGDISAVVVDDGSHRLHHDARRILSAGQEFGNGYEFVSAGIDEEGRLRAEDGDDVGLEV